MERSIGVQKVLETKNERGQVQTVGECNGLRDGTEECRDGYEGKCNANVESRSSGRMVISKDSQTETGSTAVPQGTENGVSRTSCGEVDLTNPGQPKERDGV